MRKNIFSKIIMAVAVMMVPVALGSCSNEDNFYSEAVTISGPGVTHHAATIELKQTLQLRANNGILAPGDGYTWESTNPEVATIDQNGLVTAVGLGETTIKVATTGHEVTYYSEITLYVVANSISVVDDQIDQAEAE